MSTIAANQQSKVPTLAGGVLGSAIGASTGMTLIAEALYHSPSLSAGESRIIGAAIGTVAFGIAGMYAGKQVSGSDGGVPVGAISGAAAGALGGALLGITPLMDVVYKLRSASTGSSQLSVAILGAALVGGAGAYLGSKLD